MLVKWPRGQQVEIPGMENCRKCGLPKGVCTALIEYRKAFIAYEDGKVTEAYKCFKNAITLIEEYRTQHTPLQPIKLTDDERLRLSGFF